jgi:uncharacterized protein
VSKIIWIAIGIFIAYLLLKRHRRRVGQGGAPPPAGRVEDMVRCAQCGVHLPRSESFTTRGNFYCSAEHQREHVRN